MINFRSPAEYPESQQSDRNDFTRKMDDNWSMICGPAGSIVSTVLGTVVRMPEPYWLVGRPALSGLVQMRVGPFGFDQDTMQFLAIVSQARGARVNPEDFREREDPYFAYAQSWVYNPDGYDLYSSRWKSKLVPATFMDEPARVSAAVKSNRNGAPFRILTDIIDAAAATGEWTIVNAH